PLRIFVEQRISAIKGYRRGRDENPIPTLRECSNPSYEGYKNTIELPVRNNVVPLRSDTIRSMQNGCSFHGLRGPHDTQYCMEDPEQAFVEYVSSHTDEVEDGKEIVITESSVRRDLQLADEEGIDYLPNSTIFEQLALMGLGKGFSGKVTPLFQTLVIQNQSELGEGSAMPTDPYHTPTILQPSSSQPQKTQKPRKHKRKDTQVPQPSGPTKSVTDEAVHKELGSSLVRTATIASSLGVEQDSGNITKTQSKTIPNESSSKGTNSGSGFRCEEKIGDTTAQTRFESVSKHSNVSLLARGKTLRSDEDKIKLDELMEICTNLQNRVLDLKVEFSGDEESLGDDVSKQGRRIDAIDVDEDFNLVYDANNEMFDVDDLGGDEVFVAGQNENVVEEVVNAAQVSTAVTTVIITTEEITLAQALELIEIIPDEEEVAIDAIPLAVKSPRIVDWKIHKEGKKSYYQIVRADRKSLMYMIFSQILKSSNKEDLEDLYKLVKARYGSTRSVESMDYMLWSDMKTMFKPHVEDEVWKRQQGYKVFEWKLYDSCGVHSLTMQSMQIYMLVEKKTLIQNVTKYLATQTPGRFPLILNTYSAHIKPLTKKWNSDVNLLKENVGQAMLMIKLRADVELKDTIVVAMPKHVGNGFYTCTIRVDSTNITPIIDKIDKFEKLIIDEKVSLTDDEGKPLKMVDYRCDHDSEDEVKPIDNEIDDFLASERVGFGTNSLLKQWMDTCENVDYDYDPFDDNMYKGQEIPDNLQSICDKLDIKLRGRKKK
nr:hypothetical protein [Tanacetum cinerariifolium]